MRHHNVGRNQERAVSQDKGSGLATVQKQALDRDRICSANRMEYFENKMRPFFVKGEQYVFLWRFLGLFKSRKANQDLVTWIAKFDILLQGCETHGWTFYQR